MPDHCPAQILTLPDGRQLGYARCGRPQGYPLMYFHGLPGSRCESRLLHDAAHALGLEVFAPDRPGYGLSTCQPGRRLSDWPRDVACLADTLQLEHFGVVGVSGGGPCALACAQALRRRVGAVAVVAGLGPVQQPSLRHGMSWTARLAFQLAEVSPGAVKALYGLPLHALSRLSPATALRLLAIRLGGADRSTLLQPQVLKLLSDNLREAFRQGSRAALQDVSLYRRDWGFDVQDIATPVHFWHGDADRIVPPLHSRHLHERVPGSRLTLVPGEGHFSLPLQHAATILQALRAEADQAAR